LLARIVAELLGFNNRTWLKSLAEIARRRPGWKSKFLATCRFAPTAFLLAERMRRNLSKSHTCLPSDSIRAAMLRESNTPQQQVQ